MKKTLYLLMAIVILTFGLSACGQEQNQAKEETKEETKKEVLKVGMDLKWPPFEMTDLDGNPDGISVLIANEFGEYINKDVEIVNLPFSSLMPALETNKIDVIIASMGVTEERKQKIDFSEPYMYFKLLAAVNKDSNIKSIDDLFSKEGIRFVAPKSFSSIDLVKEKANNPEVVEFDDKATATLELANGNADAFIVDAVTANGIAKAYPDNVEVIEETAHLIPVAMGIKKTDTELKEKANEFVSKLEELGVNDKIKKQYDEVLKEKVGKGYEFYLNEN